MSTEIVRAKEIASQRRQSSACRVAHGIGFAASVLLCCALGTTRGAALEDERAPAPIGTRSMSSGLPWDGRLQRGVRLRASSVLQPVPEYAGRGNFYGTSELVTLLERTALAIARQSPGSQLAVGELSAARGGKLDGHHSHRSGRDADVAFFMRDERGRTANFRRFINFTSEGIALHTSRPLYFDDARNWTLVSTLLRDREARVQYVFVAEKLRTRLLMEGRRRGESESVLRAAAAVMVEPKEGDRHAGHFHVRIYCPRDDRPECLDSAPYWPWFDGTPPEGAHDALPIIRWRTPESASPMHVPAPPI